MDPTLDTLARIGPLTQDLHVIVDNVEFRVNQSRIQTYLRCKRKYGWFHIENLEPDRPSIPLDFGSAVHAALAAVKGGHIPAAEAGDYAVVDFLKRMPEEAVPGFEELIDEAVETIRRMMPAYYETYKDAEKMETLAIEAAGKVEIGTGTGVFLVFRIDEFTLWRRMLWIMDHKTAKKMDPRDLLKYEMDLQVTAYTYAATKLLQRRVSGFIVDVLVKTKVPQFIREPFVRTDEELLEFEREFVEICRDLKTRHLRVQAGEDWKTVFYKSPHECFSYGTCWFRDLCLRDTETRRMAFRTRKPDYVDDPELLKKGKTK